MGLLVSYLWLLLRSRITIVLPFLLFIAKTMASPVFCYHDYFLFCLPQDIPLSFDGFPFNKGDLFELVWYMILKFSFAVWYVSGIPCQKRIRFPFDDVNRSCSHEFKKKNSD